MNPADLARQNAIPLEVKKDGLQQRQNGDWVLRFVVQAADMDQRLTSAPMGTRFQVALVEIDDSEMPVQSKEVMPHPRNSNPEHSTGLHNAKPQPAEPDRQSAGAKRMDWRELQPAAQAGIRCEDPVFSVFLREQHFGDWYETGDPASCVRKICNVQSRAELGTNHKARVLWHQLDESFQAWKIVSA